MAQREKDKDCKKTLDRVSATSHTNYRYLKGDEKNQRLRNIHTLYKQTKLRVCRLEEKIAEATQKSGVVLNSELGEDMKQMMLFSTDEVSRAHPEGSFARLFWDQQKKAFESTDPRQVRWHPLIIKWCLYLRHRSSGAYETLRTSGILKLPSQRTLRDYTHYIKARSGFSTEVDNDLLRVAKYKDLKDWEKCTVLLIDEMYIKEDLVYDKYTGALVGFTNLGETNEHLLKV